MEFREEPKMNWDFYLHQKNPVVCPCANHTGGNETSTRFLKIFLQKFVDSLIRKGSSGGSTKISQTHQEGIGSVVSLTSLS